MDFDVLDELENHLLIAKKALKCAWRTMKQNGMESTAKEVADTVLDVEDSHRLVKNKISELEALKL